MEKWAITCSGAVLGHGIFVPPSLKHTRTKHMKFPKKVPGLAVLALLATTVTLTSATSLRAQNGGQQFHASSIYTNPAAPPPAPTPAQGVVPTNADCANVTPVAVSIGGSVTVSGNNTGAPVNAIFGSALVWEAFTTNTCTDFTVGYCGTSPAFASTLISLGVGCPLTNLVYNNNANVFQNLCGDGNFSVVFPNLPAGTYYFPVLEAAGSSGDYTLVFSAATCTGAPPANAICAGAVELMVGTDCSPITGSVDQATAAGNTGTGCTGADISDGVWYSFVATEADMRVTVVPSPQFNAEIQIFEGDCVEFGELTCVTGPNVGVLTQLNASDLTIGETYLIRVADWYAGTPLTTTFTICAEGVSGTDCDAASGTLTPVDPNPCSSGNPVNLLSTWTGSVVPSGYQAIFLLTTGANQVIRQGAFTPSFNVSNIGEYTMHTLIFNNELDLGGLVFGQSVLQDLNGMLIQGGGTICGNLDMVGATFNVTECGPPCDALAGTLTPDTTSVCLDMGSASIGATPNEDSVVPDGFSVVYALSFGTGQVIVAGGETPSFAVENTGDYTIHTLIYDSLTLDLGTVEFGVTTVADLIALFSQGGGGICANIAVNGTVINVQDCTTTCDANAGTLTAVEADVCFLDGPTAIAATVNDDANVPSGFETLYLLTTDVDQVIRSASFSPSFNVSEIGAYTIHTLVYDPVTTDLGFATFGVTQIGEVNDLLLQGGGELCGSLDLVGAAISVAVCCPADAGTLTADDASVCFLNGPTTISATLNGDAFIPVDFEVIHVLTSGVDLVIEAANATPEFPVLAAGEYTIHTLIYDPATLDLGIIEFGVTTAAAVNALLVQGGGSICASLDLNGAPVFVEDCSPENDDCTNALELPIGLIEDCLNSSVFGDNTYATQEVGNEPSCSTTTSSYADVWYVFNSGENTEVSMYFDPGTMTDWAVTVSDACSGGIELVCELAPVAEVVITTVPNTNYWVRVYSNLELGTGGEFEFCLTGAIPTFVCDGAEVFTNNDETALSICQDGDADVVDFYTTTSSVESYMFIVTDGSDVIVAPIADNSLDFNALPLGQYRVWGVSYNGDLVGLDIGSNINDVTSTGACLEISMNFVDVNVEICSGIMESAAVLGHLYPNPTTGSFNLDYVGPDAKVILDILDASGRSVFNERIQMASGQRAQVECGMSLAAGIYTVRLNAAGQVQNLRLVIQ